MIPRWDFRNFTRLGINMALVPRRYACSGTGAGFFFFSSNFSPL